MKIIIDKVAYLQKIYFSILETSVAVTKKNIPKELLDMSNKPMFSRIEDYEFVKITDEESVKFLKESNWIKDYETINKLSIDELKNKTQSIDNQIHKSLRWYVTLDSESQKECHDYSYAEVRMLSCLKSSLEHMITEKEKELLDIQLR